MAKLKVYNQEGKKLEDLKVSDEVFALPGNNALLHQVYNVIYANNRVVVAHTKDRSERAGSGRKPFRQKGTGNARTGSVRNPIWRKGGVTFGPTNERNFKKNINKKMKRKATLVALSGKTKNDDIFVLDSINFKENKTKEFAKILENLKIEGKILVSFSEKEKDFRRFCRNIRNAKVILTKNLNVFDMLNTKKMLLTKESVKYLEDKYSVKK